MDFVRQTIAAILVTVVLLLAWPVNAANQNSDSDVANAWAWNWCYAFAQPGTNGNGGTCTWVPPGALATPATRVLYAFQPYGSVCNLGDAPYLYTSCDGLAGPYYDANLSAGSGISSDGGEGAGDGKCACGDSGAGSPNVGDPINATSGNEYLQEEDFSDSRWLTFRRFYNSGSTPVSNIGAQWRHIFDRSLSIIPAGLSAATIQVSRPDGKKLTFVKSGSQWVPSVGVPDVLLEKDGAQGQVVDYTLFVSALQQTETYDTNGLLQTVTDDSGVGVTLTYSTALTAPSIAPKPGLLLTVADPKGRHLDFVYDSAGRVHEITQPDGGALIYAYDTSSNLISVQYPDSSTRRYVYNESTLTAGTNLPNALTGKMDEAGIRYESTTFDSNGRATSSSFAGAVGATSITYQSDGTSAVQYPLGHTVTMSYATLSGLVRGVS